MATFLELVNDVERESGTIAQAQRLATVAGAIGRQEKIVAWTRQAWEMIQRERTDWTFRRKQFTGDLVIGQTGYTAAQLSITDFGGWETASSSQFFPYSLYDPALGRGDETQLLEINYRAWLDAYDVGLPPRYRPNAIARGWDQRLNLGPPPDKAYKLRGWYRREIQSLTLDADEPFIDPEYHQAIVWRACLLLAEDDEAQFEIATSGRQYDTIYSRMIAAYTEQIEV